MKRDIPAEQFEKMSNEAKKRYVVSLIIREANSMPVIQPEFPIAIVMAGVPGAGKTEYLDSLEETLKKEGDFNPFVRIDLDQIVTIYPDYTPKTYSKFRSQGNNLLARCIDELRRQKYNTMIDGTFSGTSGSSVRNIEKLLDNGYKVSLVYMYDDAATAWSYTQSREIETDRGIDKEGFISSCANISINLQTAIKEFSSNPAFTFTLVKQKKLRDKNYELIEDRKEIDAILNTGYNIDKLKETL